MSSPGTYTGKDVERYHRGEMTAAEMHELEKAALDDPMLADALDGYRHTATATTDITTLQHRLQQRINRPPQQKVFFVPAKWMKFAALFVLLAGSGWLVLRMFSGHDRNLARTETAKQGSRQSTNDSLSTVQTNLPALASDSLQRNDETVAAETGRRRGARTKVGIESESKKKTAAQVPGSGPKNDAAAPGVFAMKSSAPAANHERADSVGRFDVTQQDSEKPNDAAARRLMPSDQVKSSAPDTAEPEDGWQAFRQYLAENRRPLDKARRKGIADGDVELRFTVDKDGRPVRIVVVTSLCEECDAEAIRLLKEGPKWKGKSGRVTIPIFL